jgi:tetratricopeptide (TPR) repeat protein
MWRTVDSMLRRALVIAVLAAMGCKKAPEHDKSPPPAPPTPSTTTPSTPPAASTAASTTPAVGDLRKVGKVDFKISCAGLQPEFERAMALLHSFFYGEARRRFSELTAKDPGCAIAHWGVAMTWWHPLWAPPTPEELTKGREAIGKAATATTKSPRETGLIEALAVFYADPASTGPGSATGMSCHGPTGGGDHLTRAIAYAAAMKKLYTANPADSEIAAFYALSLLGSAKPVDPKLENQLEAAAILEKLWVDHRDHPGVAHYLIHAYDYPPLAEKGLDAAKAYAEIAPWVPHALHMPSHIFVRLGMWKDSIAVNLASADAARNYAASQKIDAMMFEELHALDYLVYGYLQTGQDAKAKEVVDHVTSVKKTYPEVDFVASYAVGAVPARYAVERHAWAEAAALQIPSAPFWTKFPFAEAHIEYARGLGRARSGDLAGAKQSLTRLDELRDATNDPKFAYFKQHLALQNQAVAAWVAEAEGKHADALAGLRKAAQMEDELGKNPVSPGPINLIYEQLGDLLILQGKPADAIAAYETALKSSPKRLDSLLGAALAAEKSGKPDVARTYYAQAVAQTADADSKRAELEHARTFVATPSK